LYIAVSKPEPFTVMPISYNNGWGGVDRSQEDPSKHHYYPLNHAGVGYHEYTSGKYMDGKPLPNTEEKGSKITNPKGSYKPMAFGPIGRAWHPRPKLAGTYDKNWLDNKFPFLPDDFKDEYYQATPPDQQMDYPRGGEEVAMLNLTPSGKTLFRLPGLLKLPVVFFLRTGERKELPALVDTLLLEPDKNRFLLTWRASLPLRRTIREVSQTSLGRTARQWQRIEMREERSRGKRRFKSLAELARSARQAQNV
jgi:hypothetical protein